MIFHLKKWGKILLVLSLSSFSSCDAVLGCLLSDHLQIDTDSLPAGRRGVVYVAEIVASVRTGFDSVDYNFSIDQGALPSGLSTEQNGRVLTIRGVPQEEGNFTFRLTVFSNDLYRQSFEQPDLNCISYQDQRDFQLLIEPAP